MAVGRNPSGIKNKIKRSVEYAKHKAEKSKAKKEQRQHREEEVRELGEEALPKRAPRTLESTREAEPTAVTPEDHEVFADEAEDEFALFFSNEKRPKIMLTTRPRPSQELFLFVGDLMNMLPNAFYYPRKSYNVKQICEAASGRDFTHVVVLSEKAKACNGMLVSVLPDGPTAAFKVSNVITSQDISHHGKVSNHRPEIILNNFNTRLGHRVGRFLGSLFPHEPQFKGRQVVTFHNQRDFVFVRHHRYIFSEGNGGGPGGNSSGSGGRVAAKTRLQELGPRFTIKLKWLQEGTFDTQFGEYEWIHKRKQMDTTRRKFHL
ncbi:unnamed protein product [Phaeothamnion confervicola]